MTMTDAQVLEIACLRVHRLRELLDPGHPDYRPEYWSLAYQLAGEPTAAELPAVRPPAPSPAAALAAIRAAEACPHRSARTDCGCAGLAGCALGRGRGDGLVALHECLDCPDRPNLSQE